MKKLYGYGLTTEGSAFLAGIEARHEGGQRIVAENAPAAPKAKTSMPQM